VPSSPSVISLLSDPPHRIIRYCNVPSTVGASSRSKLGCARTALLTLSYETAPAAPLPRTKQANAWLWPPCPASYPRQQKQMAQHNVWTQGGPRPATHRQLPSYVKSPTTSAFSLARARQNNAEGLSYWRVPSPRQLGHVRGDRRVAGSMAQSDADNDGHVLARPPRHASSV
jgi:hypothetical protein